MVNIKNLRNIILCAGRFNPPTKAHGYLFEQMIELGNKHNLRPEVFIVEGEKSSQTSDNPLGANYIYELLSKAYPEIKFDIASSAYHVMEILEVQAKKPMIWIAGSDRVKNYNKLLQYAGFLESRVMEISRDSGMFQGISATKTRQAAIDNNFEEFCSLISSNLCQIDKKKIFDKVRERNGL